MCARLAIALAALVAAVGCTPLHSTIDPPYPYQGGEYSEAEIQQIAAAACGFPTVAATPPELNPFTTDGCSLWPDGNWRECCIQHDIWYWCADTHLGREAADRDLRDCTRERSTRMNAFLMYWGVRIGGPAWLPFPWRWGYGYPWLAIPSPPQPPGAQPDS